MAKNTTKTREPLFHIVKRDRMPLWKSLLIRAGTIAGALIFCGVLSFFSLYARNEPFLMGQLSFASIGFDLSFAAACLVLTIHMLDSRRYRGG